MNSYPPSFSFFICVFFDIQDSFPLRLESSVSFLRGFVVGVLGRSPVGLTSFYYFSLGFPLRTGYLSVPLSMSILSPLFPFFYRSSRSFSFFVHVLSTTSGPRRDRKSLVIDVVGLLPFVINNKKFKISIRDLFRSFSRTIPMFILCLQ